eukprot:ctg_1879.g565
MVRHAALPSVHFGAAQFVGGDRLTDGRLHQRRAAQKDRPGALHDGGLVGHGGHVRATGRAAAHHRRQLRDTVAAHARLVVENAPEMLPIREHSVLQRQPQRVHRLQLFRVDDGGDPPVERTLVGCAGIQVRGGPPPCPPTRTAGESEGGAEERRGESAEARRGAEASAPSFALRSACWSSIRECALTSSTRCCDELYLATLVASAVQKPPAPARCSAPPLRFALIDDDEAEGTRACACACRSVGTRAMRGRAQR